jgi:hypothetical protein
MISGSISAQVASLSALSTSARDLRGGGAIFSLRTRNIHVSHSAAPIRIPGKMPARNSLEIDTLPATPKMTNPIDGGITGPITPHAAIRPPERALSWPAFTIIGSSSAVSAAASATAEPDNADNRQAATIAT